MDDQNNRLQEKTTWLRILTDYVKPGRIVELGCGSGFVLEILSRNFPHSTIIGIDKSIKRLEKVAEKNLKNVVPIKADITESIFFNKVFDTTLFVGSLHEVFSYLGREKVEKAFRIAYDTLKDDGVLIIQDFLRLPKKLVEMSFKNEETLRKFLRFAEEFRPRRVKYKKTGGGFELDLGDAIEFISKYRSPSEEDWKEEMGETHFFFREEDYIEVAERTGFAIKTSRRLVKSERWWQAISEDLELKFEPEYGWIQLVLVKK